MTSTMDNYILYNKVVHDVFDASLNKYGGVMSHIVIYDAMITYADIKVREYIMNQIDQIRNNEIP